MVSSLCHYPILLAVIAGHRLLIISLPRELASTLAPGSSSPRQRRGSCHTEPAWTCGHSVKPFLGASLALPMPSNRVKKSIVKPPKGVASTTPPLVGSTTDDDWRALREELDHSAIDCPIPLIEAPCPAVNLNGPERRRVMQAVASLRYLSRSRDAPARLYLVGQPIIIAKPISCWNPEGRRLEGSVHTFTASTGGIR
ncbi:hypothetical protein B0H34DRAFT_860198 [Crassisporium funariophilum]|nr:hypothetical protein B0H34DRAFT_860198 [Crassisporium funariophilum]